MSDQHEAQPYPSHSEWCKLCGNAVVDRMYHLAQPRPMLTGVPPGGVRQDSKPTNPKDAIGVAKVPWSTIPARVLGELGLALLEGACKYGRHNYRAVGVRASVYYDATHRHLAAWWEGQDTDPDSGLSHITKAIASLVVLRDSMVQGNWNDDRPPPVSDPAWVTEMNARAREILDRHPDPKPPHTR